MKKDRKTAEICYNENNHKLKATERRFFMEQIAIFVIQMIFSRHTRYIVLAYC